MARSAARLGIVGAHISSLRSGYLFGMSSCPRPAQVSTADTATVSYGYQWWGGTAADDPPSCVGIRRATHRGLPYHHLVVVISTYYRSQRDRFAEWLMLSVSGGGFVAEL